MIPERALTVSELNEYVRKLLAGDVLLRSVEVSGEISGYKLAVSGHRYFTLKDENCYVKCAMFRQNALSLDFQPQDGMRVVVRGSASLYPRDGAFQLYVTGMRRQGVGDLYLRFEALKKKLGDEGLFDPARKREIPMLPGTIGIVTSRTGAALRDMVRIAKRRNPNVGVVVAPCAVQGEGAAAEIVRAIEALNRDGRAEVILCGRGGGSIEDLWAFNEEIVARAIAASKIPVISCVGHETDFTIADFVADARAATPSMAAELAVPVAAELRRSLDAAMARVSNGVAQANRLRRSELKRVCASQALVQPRRILIESRRDAAALMWARISNAGAQRLQTARNRLERADVRLAALNPSGVLERGYACVSVNGKIVGSVRRLQKDMDVRLRFADGAVGARITESEGNYAEETDV